MACTIILLVTIGLVNVRRLRLATLALGAAVDKWTFPKAAPSRLYRRSVGSGLMIDRADRAFPSVVRFQQWFLRRMFVFMFDKIRWIVMLPPLRILVREIWLILDERERVDFIDEQEGQHVQDMVRPSRGSWVPNPSCKANEINGRKRMYSRV